MARLVFGMNQSLDGYVDHDAEGFASDPVLFRHFIDITRDRTGSLYGRRLYEIMAWWDDDQPGWTEAEHDFAAAWRMRPKWVVSRSLTSVGPNATLIDGDLATAVRRLKADLPGTIEIGGPDLARQLDGLGLVDEFQIFLHPVVLGRGTPFFAGPRPGLRLTGADRIGRDVIRLTYVPT